MKNSYPVIMTPDEHGGYVVYVPDFAINTQGDDLTEAIAMARDAIGLAGIDLEDDGKVLPEPSDISAISSEENEIVTLVDVDFSKSRTLKDVTTVRKNCTLPAWLCYEAEKADINFSRTLQKALKSELHLY